MAIEVHKPVVLFRQDQITDVEHIEHNNILSKQLFSMSLYY